MNAVFLVMLIPVLQVGGEASLHLLHHLGLEVSFHLTLNLLMDDISLMLEFCSILISYLVLNLLSSLISYF